MYGLYSLDVKDSLQMAPRCRNMQEVNTYLSQIVFYYVLLLVGVLITRIWTVGLT